MPPRQSDPTFDNDFAFSSDRRHYFLQEEIMEEEKSPPPQLITTTATRHRTQQSTVLDTPSVRPSKQPDRQNGVILLLHQHDDQTHTEEPQRQLHRPLLPLTVSLPLLNLIDMLAVALVIPLLVHYYKAAGVTNASHRELLSSIFSSAQIVGGLVLGALSNAGWLRRRTLLLLSFGGSAVSYFMIASGGRGLATLIISRILVGLVKQTVTVTTSMLTQCTTKENRAAHMGRLTASSTVAWVVGPSVGAILYKYVDERAPALVASLLFLINIVLALVLLPADDDHETHNNMNSTNNEIHDDDNVFQPQAQPKEQPQKSQHHQQQQRRRRPSSNASQAFASFWTNLQSCFRSWDQGSVIVSLLLFTWVMGATSFATLGSFYEDMYGVEPHHRGYISSYQQALGFVVQSMLVTPILSSWCCGGCERRAACWSALLLAVATLFELKQSLAFFLLVLCPAISLSIAMMNLSLRSLITQVAPAESIFSILAALDVLQNASSVTVPIYRTWLLTILPNKLQHPQASQQQPLISLQQCSLSSNHTSLAAAMEPVKTIIQGDPDPSAWVLSSAVHWFVAALLICYCLLSTSSSSSSHKNKRPTNPKDVSSDDDKIR